MGDGDSQPHCSLSPGLLSSTQHSGTTCQARPRPKVGSPHSSIPHNADSLLDAGSCILSQSHQAHERNKRQRAASVQGLVSLPQRIPHSAGACCPEGGRTPLPRVTASGNCSCQRASPSSWPAEPALGRPQQSLLGSLHPPHTCTCDLHAPGPLLSLVTVTFTGPVPDEKETRGLLCPLPPSKSGSPRPWLGGDTKVRRRPQVP